jgi:enediyne polyketide synthase
MTPALAIVGMACRYPDARSPRELWENALAQRQAFRRMPSERLRLEDYFSPDRHTPDQIYATEAALIEGFSFDRTRFRVAGSTFRSADLTHWLALNVAAEALADAGFAEGNGLPRTMTGVLLGNTLTGEFSRANVMRLRWPYVQRVVGAALNDAGWSAEQRQAFLLELEQSYKAPFPPVTEETLAGGMSNTIAGRICNYFDLKGGGYAVDGACASSLLAVATACSALIAGDLDVALAGGVDLSLDPFELVGFAKTGALAAEQMRVYDARSAGFWPGEGCGFVVLMRHADALAQNRPIHAVIRGWGVSSDGSGGITRPEVDGQILAVERAYQRAGFDITTIGYFEGHGTGTTLGDTTELRMLAQARRGVEPAAPPAVISSIKANIGHTKAASGVAGLIKATMALSQQILPPATGCDEPHAELSGAAPALRVLHAGECWSADQPLRAGVSAMGFGGINVHLALEGTAADRTTALDRHSQLLVSSPQDAELCLLSAQDAAALERQIEHLLTIAPRLSRAEISDLAAHLSQTLDRQEMRAAIVATSPDTLTRGLLTLKTWLADGITTALDAGAGVFLGTGTSAPRLGFLFPGQGSPAHVSGGMLRRRFGAVQKLYAEANLPTGGDSVATSIAQPAIVTASLAALTTLARLGIEAQIGIGHSLGELTALHWAGAFDDTALLRIATLRGKAMAELGAPTGAMASIEAGRREVEWLLNNDSVNIACFNSPRQTIISGERAAVDALIARAQSRGLHTIKLPVSHAFHSPLVAAAVPALAQCLAGETFQPLQHTVVSTVTGAPLSNQSNLATTLCRQVIAPVRFTRAISAAAEHIDLWLEVGPGRVLSGLVGESVNAPVIALDAGGPSLVGLLNAVGAVFALGAPVNHAALFADRFTRPFSLDWQPQFFVNPCELAPTLETDQTRRVTFLTEPDAATPEPPAITADPATSSDTGTALDLFRQLVAERAEIPVETIQPGDHLLSDLHLNSIAVSQLVIEATRRLKLPAPAQPTAYANATIAQVVAALTDQVATNGTAAQPEPERDPAGVDAWVRSFTVELVPTPQPHTPRSIATGDWQIITAPDYPLAEALRHVFMRVGGGGIVVALPSGCDTRHVRDLLEGAQAALALGANRRFVLVQHGGGAAAVARTLYLERSDLTVCVVDVPIDHPQAAAWVAAEAAAAEGYVEAHYAADGTRYEPRMRLLPPPTTTLEQPLGSDDVLLVLGGGKGITAECAIAIAQDTDAQLVLLGRSQAQADPELGLNLQRMQSLGIRAQYIAVDITDAAAVRTALHDLQAATGTITGILHGAARNVPQLLTTLDEATVLQTLAPKIGGLQNVLAAIDPDRLRLLVTFGSIIARTGLPGEADYGLANEWLARLTAQFQAEHPACRCLCVEWSIWSSVGMGARLGTIETLMRSGITPIPPDQGVAMLRRLLTQPLPTVAVVVSGRTGSLPTLKLEQPELPFWRFLEQPRVYYRGIELIVEAELSPSTDPYFDEHIFRGERLLPGVVGLEAMAQVAMALVETITPPVFTDVQFNRPIALPRQAPLTIRLAALVRTPGQVQVTLRSAETAFQVDYFRATCCFDTALSATTDEIAALELPPVAVDPRRELYGSLFFQGPRFQRLRQYHRLTATGCIAELEAAPSQPWFGRYLPPALVLGDPGVRDATIHAIQSCVPHVALLPIGIERFIPEQIAAPGPWQVYARERRRDGDTFIYDIAVLSESGSVRERWEGLQLRVIDGETFSDPWVAPLLGPYIERRVQELIPGAEVAVVVERAADLDRHDRSDRAIQRALGAVMAVRRRPDGKPEVLDGRTVSAAHAADLTLALAGSDTLGCDVEPVVTRARDDWAALLGSNRLRLADLLSRETGADQATAATRVWAAGEALTKAGAMADTPLVLDTTTADGWVVLAAEALVIATYVTEVRGMEAPLALAILVRRAAPQFSATNNAYAAIAEAQTT